MKKQLLPALVAAAFAAAPAAHAADFILVNVDPPGVGFNDPSPATPVGGNAGTTVGEQRLIAYQRALQLWGSVLKSDVPITVLGGFEGLPCDAGSGVLARAGAWNIELNFPGAKFQNTWYHSALANSIAGKDLYPGTDIVDGADILAQFNGNVGKTGCIEGSTWYYGLDNKPGPNETDFLNVFMHELSHGLGFSNFVNEATGRPFAGIPDIYSVFTRDTAINKQWNAMSPAEIRASATRAGRVVWSGSNVTAQAKNVLAPLTVWKFSAPASLATVEWEIGTASFGPEPTPANFSGQVVIGRDSAGTGPSTTDACGPLTNASAVAGKIALVDRGSCTFATKVKNAQNAGAVGVIVANNVAGGGAIGLGGADATITIPSIGVAKELSDAFKAAETALGSPLVAPGGLAVSPTRLAGADANSLVRLYAPTPVALGSSISHFDTVASPNLLMEPFITASLRATGNVDLTAALFADIGWAISPVNLAGCGRTQTPSISTAGEIYVGPVYKCADSAPNKGQFQACTTQYLDALKSANIISGQEKGSLNSCAATLK